MVWVLRPESLIDIDELIAALAGARLDVLDNRAERLHHAADVVDLREIVDLFPTRLDVVGRNLASESEQLPLGPFPAKARVEPSANFVHSPGGIALLAAKIGHNRRDVLGLERVEHRRRQQPLRETRCGKWRDGVDEDVLALPFERQRVRKADEAELCRPIVGLPEVAVDACRRCRKKDSTVALLGHDGPRGFGHLVCAVVVDPKNDVPVGVGHVLERLVAQDPRVVDHDVDTPPGIRRRANDRITVLDRVVVRDRLATGLLDFLDDSIRCFRGFAFATRGTPEVVDDDLRASRRQQQRMRPAEPLPSSSDNGNAPLKPDFFAHIPSASQTIRADCL